MKFFPNISFSGLFKIENFNLKTLFFPFNRQIYINENLIYYFVHYFYGNAKNFPSIFNRLFQCSYYEKLSNLQ